MNADKGNPLRSSSAFICVHPRRSLRASSTSPRRTFFRIAVAGILPPHMAETSANADLNHRTPALALVVATLFWGFGFTWAKVGGGAVNAAMGLPDGAYVGPLFLLAWRF